jgi:hypothetical protein
MPIIEVTTSSKSSTIPNRTELASLNNRVSGDVVARVEAADLVRPSRVVFSRVDIGAM